jgi:hypothetical protein
VAAADRLDLNDYSIPPAFVIRLGGPLRRGVTSDSCCAIKQ